MSPSIMRVKKSRPTARTNGAANGSSMIASGWSLATRAGGGDHRGCGTDAGRQVPAVAGGSRSSQVRVILLLVQSVSSSARPVSILSKCNELARLYACSGRLPGDPEPTCPD